MFKPLPKPEKKPPKSENESPKSFFEKLEGWVNPIPTTWFQSINACAIFVLAPFFAALWTYLARHNMNPSIPTKMALGVLLMGLSFAVMVGAAKEENKPTTVAFKGTDLPSGVALNEQNQLCHADKESKPHEPYQAGRLKYDPATHTFRMSGVLADIERDRIVRDTAPSDFVKKAEQLQKGSAKIGEEREKEVHVTLDKEPPGFDMRYAGFKQKDVNYDRATKTLTSRIALADKDRKALLVAAGEPELRDTLNELMVESSRYRVSPWWLFWSYILATLGELCLSPVGLSMVSKLAPAKFATMLMGLWMLTSFFGNYIAGAFGEIWGVVAPVPFFLISVAALGVASLILFVLTRKIVAIMHGVN